MIAIDNFIRQSLDSWPLAQRNYQELAQVESRWVDLGDGECVRLQFNPKRIVSTGAKMDAKTLAERPCFLCQANRPAEQMTLDWGKYQILVNPFPIFPRHLTIPLKDHAPQDLRGRAADMCSIAAALPGYVVFFNGARSGASAPDHMHFQAGNADFLPNLHLDRHFETIEILERDLAAAAERVEQALDGLDPDMLNVLCWSTVDGYRVTMIPRKTHRPSFYGNGPGQMIISPATVDLAGVLITPRREDYERIDAPLIKQLYQELCFARCDRQ